MKRVFFFTAGLLPTADELAIIGRIQSMCEAPFVVTVMNSQASPNYGTPAVADYVAGEIPTAYDEVPVFDVDEPPRPDNLPETAAIVMDGQAIEVAVSGTYTNSVSFVVEDGEIVGVELS